MTFVMNMKEVLCMFVITVIRSVMSFLMQIRHCLRCFWFDTLT